MSPWHLPLRPCGATSRSKAGAAVHGQRPWLSAVGARRVTFGVLSPILSILLTLGLSLPAFAPAQSFAATGGKASAVRDERAATGRAQADPATKNVLLLFSGRYIAPLSIAVDEAVRATFQRSPSTKVELYAETLDVARFDPERHGPLLAAYLREKFADRKPNLIITSLPQAPRFLLKFRKELFPDTPIVYCLADESELAALTPAPNVTGVPLRIPWKETLDLALGVHPDTLHVVVIAGTDSLARLYLRDTQRVFRPYENRLAFTYLTDRTLPQLLKEVASLPPHTVIIYTTFAMDGAGQVYIDAEVSGMVAKAANAPVYSINNTFFGRGITGGHIIDNGAHATRATEIGLRILAGEKPEAIVVGGVPSPPKFDARQLKRWNIAESRLPAGSIVLYKEPSFWLQYRLPLLILGVCILEALLIVALLVHRRRRRLAEARLQENEERLRLAMNAAALGVWSWDIPRDRILLSERVRKMLAEPPPSEVTYAAFLSMVDREDRAGVDAALQEAIRTGSDFEIEYRVPQRDGTVGWMASRGSCTHRKAGTPVRMTGVSQMVTERKLAKEALEEQLRFERLVSDISARFVNIPPDRVDPEIERGLREILEFFQVDRCALLQILPDKTSWQISHVAAKESVPPVPQGTKLLVSINPWAYDKLIRKQEVLSVSRLDDLPAEANVDMQTWIEWGIRSNLNIPIVLGGPVDHVFAINSVKSERAWPEEFIPRLRLLGEILVNALERRQIRLQIEERLRFEGLISNLSAGFVNLPSDKFESQINKELRSITEFFNVGRCSIGLFSEDGTQIARAFEYHSAEAEPTPVSMSKEQIPWFIGQLIQGKPVVMNRVEDLPPEAEKERQLCLAKGMKSLLSVPMLSEGKTLGSCALVSTRTERVWPEELVQRFRLISEVFANVLERKRAEQEAFDARRELTRMERLSRMGELSASLSHELNQPLTAILSNARAALRFLQTGKLDPGELEEILQDIVKDDKRAGDIIRNLRAMVKPEEGEQELTSINNVLHETVVLFRSEAIIRNVKIKMDLADALPLLHINKVQIQQVLINLMMNAAESMTGDESAEKVIVLQTAASGEGVVKVAVRDFGSGIEEQQLRKIFEPFFTTKRSGLGMGLSLSRSIIESHGGHIWAENNPDKGITFYFDLPGSRGER